MTSYNLFRDLHLSRVLPARFAKGSSATDAPTAGAHRPAVN